MSNGARVHTGGVITRRVTGILDEAQYYGRLQLALARTEALAGVRAAGAGLAWVAGGGAVVVSSLVLFGMAAAEGLHAAFPEVPAWAGYCLAASPMAVAGAIALVYGSTRLSAALAAAQTGEEKPGELEP